MITDHRSPSSACRLLVFDVQGVEHRLRSLWRDGYVGRLHPESGVNYRISAGPVRGERMWIFRGPLWPPGPGFKACGLCCDFWSSVEIRVSVVGVGAGVYCVQRASTWSMRGAFQVLELEKGSPRRPPHSMTPNHPMYTYQE